MGRPASPGQSPLPAARRHHHRSADQKGIDERNEATSAQLALWPLRALVSGGAWLHQPHTRRAYSTDLDRWFVFCADHGLGTLAARRLHLDAWARSLEEAGLRPRTVARRLSAVASWKGYLVA